MSRNSIDSKRQLIKVAHSQGGYFTAAQALRSGYSYRQQHYHRQRGNWICVDRGVFRLRDYPASPHEDLIRWSLWSRNKKGIPRAVVSHETALSLHELGDLMPSKTHLTVPPGFRKKVPDGCVIHKAVLKNDEIESRPGFFLTTPLKTIQDIVVEWGNDEVTEGVIRDALKKGLVIKSRLLASDMDPKTRKRIEETIRKSLKKPSQDWQPVYEKIAREYDLPVSSFNEAFGRLKDYWQTLFRNEP